MTTEAGWWGPATSDRSPVTVQYTLTPDEVARALRWRVLRNWRFWIGPVVGLVFLVFGIGLIATSPSGMTAYPPVSLFVLGALWLVWYPIRALVVGPSRAWSRKAGLQEQQTITFSDENIHTRAAEVDVTSSWSKVYRACYESPDAYLLQFASRPVYVILPKRAFASPDDERHFRRLVETHLEPHLQPRA